MKQELLNYIDKRLEDTHTQGSIGLLMVRQWVVDNVPETKWIPVSERLPEKEGYYLTTTIFKEVYCDYWNGDNFDRTEMVISWMPLPDPWKGDNDD